MISHTKQTSIAINNTQNTYMKCIKQDKNWITISNVSNELNMSNE